MKNLELPIICPLRGKPSQAYTISEVDATTKSTEPKNKQLAAIYVSQSAKQQVSIAKQIEACQKFLCNRGLLFSGDFFQEKEGVEFVNELVRSRARSHRFDYVASYVLCPSESGRYTIGVIVCWSVQNFLKKPTQTKST